MAQAPTASRTRAEATTKDRLDELADQISQLVVSVSALSASQAEIAGKLVASEAAARATTQPDLGGASRPLSPAAAPFSPGRGLLEPLESLRVVPPRPPVLDWEAAFPQTPVPVFQVTANDLPFGYGEFDCLDGAKRVRLGFPVVRGALDLDQHLPYHVGPAACLRGVPCIVPVQVTDPSNHLACTRLLADSVPKHFELQYLGSAVAWQHSILAGQEALEAAFDTLPADTLRVQLRHSFAASRLVIAAQTARLKYLALAGDQQLGDAAVRNAVVQQVGQLQRSALYSPLLTAPQDVDEVAFAVANELALEVRKQTVKADARSRVDKT